MTTLEVLGAIVLLMLASATAWMAAVGLLGAVGALRLRRCRSCGHLLPRSSQQPLVCPYCRHPWLTRHVNPVHLRHLLPEEMDPISRPLLQASYPGLGPNDPLWPCAYCRSIV